MDFADARAQIWLARVHHEITQLSTILLPTDELHTARMIVIDTVSIFLRRAYPDVIIYPFASHVTRTYLPDESIKFELRLPQDVAHDHIVLEVRDLLNESALPLHGLAEANQDRRSVTCCPGAIDVEFFILSDPFVSQNAPNAELPSIYDNLGSEFPGLLPIFMVLQRAVDTDHGSNQRKLPPLVLFCLVVIYFRLEAPEELRHLDANYGLHILLLSKYIASELDFAKRISIADGGRLLDRGPRRPGSRAPVWVEHPCDSTLNIAATIHRVSDVQEFFGSIETRLRGALEDSDLIAGLGTSEYWPAQLSTTIMSYSGLHYDPAPRDLIESIPRLQMLQNYWLAPRRLESNEVPYPQSTPGASTSQAAFIDDDDDEAGYYGYVSDHPSDDVRDEFNTDDDDDDGDEDNDKDDGKGHNEDNVSSASLSLSIADDFADSFPASNEGSIETIIVTGGEGEESDDDAELVEVHAICFPAGWRRW